MSVAKTRCHWRADELRSGPWELEVTPELAGWQWSTLRVANLAAGESLSFSSGGDEALVMSLNGSVDVECDGEHAHIVGRDSVFSDVSDFVYIPANRSVRLFSERGGRFAIPAARASSPRDFSYRAKSDIPVEYRGAGSCSRRVVNFCTSDSFDAERLIACEVFTPAGNWSSYPPHKHDELREGESVLEEIYYFEVAPHAESSGVAYQRVYGTQDRPIEVLAEVHSGDVVVVPHGWHGPSIAAPGYDLYYLNVMAGPGERVWLTTIDPDHEWVRSTWETQEFDPRALARSEGEDVR